MIEIALLVIAYIVVGILLGSTTTRVGYAVDRDVKRALRSVSETKAAWDAVPNQDSERWEVRGVKRAYDDAVKSSRETLKRCQSNWLSAGRWVLVLWPLAICAGVVVVMSVVLFKLARSGIRFALTPSQYTEHAKMLGDAPGQGV